MKTLWGHYKGSYFCYILTFFFYFMAMALFSSVLSVYLTDIGKSAAEMSFIISASGLFSFAMVPAVGYLNDLTRRPRLISGLLLLGVGLLGLVFALCRGTWALFLLDGLIMSFINSIMPISERMAGQSKYRYGVLRVWGTLGYAVGAQCAGLAVQYFPPMALFAGLLISCALTVLGFAGTEEKDPPAPSQSPRPQKPPLSSLVQNRHFLLYVLAACLFAGCSGVNMNLAPILLGRLGVATGMVGTVLFFSTLIEIPLILFSHKYMDKFSGKALMLTSFAIITVQFLFYGISSSPTVVVTVMVLLKAVASTLFQMITLKMVRNLLPSALTTTGLSVINSLNSVSTILLQNAGGLVTDRFGIQILYLCLAVLTGLGMLLALGLPAGNREKVFS